VAAEEVRWEMEAEAEAEAEVETKSEDETADCDNFVMESADPEPDWDEGFEEETVQKKPQDSEPLERLARLQSFDGCLSSEVFTFLKITETDLHAIRFLFPLGVADVDMLAATVLAMVFLQSGKRSAEAEQDAWEGITSAPTHTRTSTSGSVGLRLRGKESRQGLQLVPGRDLLQIRWVSRAALYICMSRVRYLQLFNPS
jgi:hypothetical protein